MVQHTIFSLLQNCKKYGVSYEKIVEKLAHKPATIYKVNNRGFLREGYYADIVLIDSHTPTFVTKDSLLYNNPSSSILIIKWYSISNNNIVIVNNI